VTVPAIPLITEGARYVLGFSVGACVLGLCIAVMIAVAGRHSGSGVAAWRGLLGALILVLVFAVVLLLVLIYLLHRG
jgi:multisubunit Na+/H+ antiporter MnhB subunit